MDISKCSDDLKKFINMCEDVHKIIKDRDLARLKDILSQNPNIKYFYNLQNESALKSAVTCGSTRIYKYMIEKNYSLAPHEDIEEIIASLNITDREDLHKIHIQCTKDLPEKHINILMHNTSVTHDDTDEHGKLDLVRRAYRILSKDPRLKIILQIVAAVKIFHIVFDFCRDSTIVMDPTTSNSTTGVFYSSGRIIVAARQLHNKKTEHETFGALVHELCHFAIYEVFENKSNPFRKSDRETKTDFERILDICRQNKDKEKVINNVYECYGKVDQLAELVVRPAHLIAMYHKQPKVLKRVIKTYPELFEFFEKFVIPEMIKALPKIDARLAYLPAIVFSDLTDQRKTEVKNAVVMYKSVRIRLSELFSGNLAVFDKILPVHISQILSKKTLNFNDPQLRYLEVLINYNWQTLPNSLRDKVLYSKLIFQGQSIKFKDLHQSCPGSFHSLTFEVINSILDNTVMNIGEEVKPDSQFYVDREFIPEDAKLIDFEYQYGSKYTDHYETRKQHREQRMHNRTLETFSKGFLRKNFAEISRILDEAKANPHFKACYFDLCQNGYSFMHKSSTELIAQAINDKILILSSEAGAGKTLTFEHLAVECKALYPTKWIVYIDLSSYTKLYKDGDNVEKLLKRILSLDSAKNAFEAEIFDESFRSGNVVVIWNGFDEISPTYNKFIINALKYIRYRTKNVQFVCTRPLYSDQLSKTFQVRSWQLLPFDDDKKQQFLKEYFALKEVPADKIEAYIKNVEKIVNKLNYEKLSFAYDFNSPLMLKLLAAIHKNADLFQNAHIYGIFESFIHSKIVIWLEKCKNSFSTAATLVLNIKSLIKFFQKYALLNEARIFSSTNLALKIRKLNIMQEVRPDCPTEEITRLGILYINDKNEFQFCHKTMSEFFVAQYFIENIFSSDMISDDEAELRLELFHHLTNTYGNIQQIITDFMGSYLQMKNKNAKTRFNPIILKLLRTKFNNFLFRMLDTNHPEVFEFLFPFFNKDHGLLVDLLHVHKDETFYTAIFNPNYFALSTNPEEIKVLAGKYLTGGELKKFVNGRNQKGKILLGMHFYRSIGIKKSHDSYDSEIKSLDGASYWQFFEKYLGNENLGLIEKMFSKKEDRKLSNINQQEVLMTALSPKIYLFYNEKFSSSDFIEYRKLWDNFENLLPTKQMMSFLGDILVHFFEICAYEFAGHEKFLSLILEKVEKFLTNSDIFQMFLTKNILHGAPCYHASFVKLWEFLKSHTEVDQRKEILNADNSGDKSFYFYFSRNEDKKKYTKKEYSYMYYDFTKFKLFHRAFITNSEFVQAIYESHFSKTEIQNMILESNEFLYYTIRTADENRCNQLALYLQNMFLGSESSLREFLKKEIENTDLTIFEFIETFRGLPHSKPKWFENVAIFNRINV
ncbi:uncharacterized protein [Chironomus tepperi]|uniref:uncharacterized protein n=1 Tax=Chironomus tepperi TaxID=113505 RepID=UPI00391F740C